MFLTKNNKSPFFQLVYKINGKRTTVSTMTADRVQAEIFLKHYSIPDAKPLAPITITQPPIIQYSKPAPLLSDFEQEYIAFHSSSKSKHYIRSIRLSFKMLRAKTGDITLDKFDRRTIDQFISAVYTNAKKGAALYYRTLKAAFSTAESWEYIKENPFRKVKLPKTSQSLPAFITQQQLHEILTNTDREDLKSVFITAFYTGMRINEILNLHRNSFDIEKGIIHLKNTVEFTTKSKKERIIPIAPALQTYLQSHFAKLSPAQSLAFPSISGKKLDSTYVSKVFKRIIRQCGLNEAIHFHSLRHSFASNLVQRGASIFVVQKLLGHEDVKTTMVYSHLNQESLKSTILLLQ